LAERRLAAWFCDAARSARHRKRRGWDRTGPCPKATSPI